jgi:hypothetical protein
VVQRVTFNQQPSSSGTVTLALPKTSGAGDALIVGVSFWPMDLSSVTDSSGDTFTRGVTTSIYHNVSQGVMYTNFYYAKNTAGGASSITLKFSGGKTYMVAAVAEVAGLNASAPLDASAYKESLSSVSPWSSAALTTATANEYLFSWAADEWNNPSCSNPTSGWTVTQNNSGATLCLLDRTISTAGSYQAAVTPSSAFNYGMEIVAFKGVVSAPPPAPLTITTTTLPAGTVGTAYSTTLAATGGVSPYTWSASGLPGGLSLSSAGTISGTPTASGTFSASITVLDSTNAKASASETIAVASAPAPPPPVSSSITVIQRATLNQQPSSSGTVTLALPKASGAGDALIVGVSFWPLDVTSVTDSSGDAFTRGLTSSMYHNVSQGAMYTNFYYAKSTAGGATSITLNFSGGSTYVVAAVAEVAGLNSSAPLDSAAYNESLSSASPWSSAALTTATANEYLFSWAADEWNGLSCSNPASGWTVTQSNSGATLCLLDRTISAAGSYQAAVTPSSAFNYAMEIVAFEGASSASGSGTGSAPASPPAAAPLAISTTTLPAGTVGTAYSATLAATGGVSPYTWSASGLPSGLSVSSAGPSTGTISGMPTAAGTQNAAVTIQDSTGTTASASLPVAIGGPSLPGQPAVTYNLLHFGNAGFGGDDTNVFQTALTYTAANAAALEIPAGSYNISPVTFPANSYVVVDANVTVSANPGYGSSAEMLNINAGPVTIIGAGSATSVFQMPLAHAASISDGSQFRHCLEIGNGGAAKNVTISGIACNQSGGDGLYIRNATNVTVQNCLFNGNYRNGASITGEVNGITLIGNYFTNNSGTLPKSGIDIEPNSPTDFLLNISLQNNYTDSNAGDGLEFELEELTSASQPVSITVSGHHSDGNGRYGYVGLNNYPTNPGGTVLVENSFSNGDGDFCAIGRFWQAGGTLLSFQNLTCTNPHVNGPDPSYGSSAAVGALRGGGATIPMGNISFTGVNISATNGMTTYYFDFEDGSGKGTSNVVFEPGTLSGATKAPPIGLLLGVGYSSIN